MKHMIIMICAVIFAGLVTLIYLWPRYEEKQELDPNAILSYSAALDSLAAALRDSTLSSDPCPPCPDTVYRMPKGWWYKTGPLCDWCRATGQEITDIWPDSVFILKGE